MGIGKTVCKVPGITLIYKTSQLVIYDLFQDMVLNGVTNST